MTLKDFVASKGFPIFDLDNKIHRFDVFGGKNNGWFRGSVALLSNGNNLQYCAFGDWRTSETFRFRTQDETGEGDIILDKLEETMGLFNDKLHKEVATRDAKWFNSLPLWTNEQFEYLVKKGIKSTKGVRESVYRTSTTMVVPLYNIHGAHAGHQQITLDGEKIFCPGMKTKGAFHSVGMLPLVDGANVYICEGYSTGVSVFEHFTEGTKLPVLVLCAMNANNIANVAQDVRLALPMSSIIIMADNDRLNLVNVGVMKALAAAKKVGATVLVPWPMKGTDYNDCAVHGASRASDSYLIERGGDTTHVVVEHLDRPADVAAPNVTIVPNVEPLQINANSFESETPGWAAQVENVASTLNALEQQPIAEPPSPEPAQATPAQGEVPGIALEPVEMPENKKPGPKPKLPNEQFVARDVISFYDGNLCSQGDDLYLYNGKYWERFTDEHYKSLRQKVYVVAGAMAGSRFVNNAVKTLSDMLPSPQKRITLPQPDFINFNNGTVKVDIKNKRLVFHPHFREDYVTNIVPIDWVEDSNEENFELMAMFDRVFKNDPHKESKMNAVMEMYGAMVFPVFPRLFYLVGKPGCGKSSVIMPGQALVSEKNIGLVDPTLLGQRFQNFQLMGKTVNIRTDINLVKPISDSEIKMILDRAPYSFEPKGKAHIMGYMPAVHIYGGNDTPKSFEKSEAHQRRWSFITFGNEEGSGFDYKAEGADQGQDFGRRVHESNPVGTLNFARKGFLRILAQGGKYSQPGGGHEAIERMQRGADPVLEFLEEIKLAGEQGCEIRDRVNTHLGRVFLDPKGRVRNTHLWTAFNAWQDNARVVPAVRKSDFYDSMTRQRFPLGLYDGYMCYKNIRFESSTSTQ